jgi:hypothetical protein
MTLLRKKFRNLLVKPVGRFLEGTIFDGLSVGSLLISNGSR